MEQPVRFHFEDSGSGPPLILIHGLVGSLDWWTRNVDALAERFRTYRIDLAGFGKSRDLATFRLDRAAELIARWMESEQIARASVVGHSMGGMIAARLAADFPHRVDRLVLVDAAFLSFDSGLSKRTDGLLRALGSTPTDFLRTFVRDALRTHPRTFVSATAELLRADWSHILSEVEALTLVVWGENDTITPKKIGIEMIKAIPNCSLLVIEGAGHNPMWDQADRFNAAVLDFLGHADG